MPVSIGYSANPQRAVLARLSAHAGAPFSGVRKWVATAVRHWVERREAIMALRSIDERTLRDIGVRRPTTMSALYDDRR